MAPAAPTLTVDLPPRPPVKHHRMTVRIEADRWQELETAARTRGATASEVVRHLIDRALSGSAAT
jgi:hypothetical protein